MIVLSPVHCRAARGALKWSQEALAARSGVGLSTIRDFEAERRSPMSANLRAIRHALESAGVVLLPAEPGEGLGPGVRLRWSDPGSQGGV
jgi:transcriptional regulator with XRE-family HTH domain